MDFQGSWRWCHKCQGAFFAGHPTQGVCPADKKAHDESQSGAYVTRLNAESAPPGVTSMPFFGGTLTSPYSGQQGGWRWCHKCEGLFFAGGSSQGVCPADQHTHDASQSGHYAVVFDDGAAPAVGQIHWRWCYKCEGFFFAGNPSQGVCPSDNKPHDASKSGKYQLEFQPAPIVLK
jgi:hypothetical protein